MGACPRAVDGAWLGSMLCSIEGGWAASVSRVLGTRQVCLGGQVVTLKADFGSAS